MYRAPDDEATRRNAASGWTGEPFQADLRRRRRRILIISGVTFSALLFAGVGIVLYVLGEIGNAMSGDPECIESLSDGGTPGCFHGRRLPALPALPDASS